MIGAGNATSNARSLGQEEPGIPRYCEAKELGCEGEIDDLVDDFHTFSLWYFIIVAQQDSTLGVGA